MCSGRRRLQILFHAGTGDKGGEKKSLHERQTKVKAAAWALQPSPPPSLHPFEGIFVTLLPSVVLVNEEHSWDVVQEWPRQNFRPLTSSNYRLVCLYKRGNWRVMGVGVEDIGNGLRIAGKCLTIFGPWRRQRGYYSTTSSSSSLVSTRVSVAQRSG